jgi:hypothetical protein
MSIKFICSCGKHLRARDEMAARRSMCPRCGNPVGVPSLRATPAGTQVAPLTPQERRRLNRNKPSSDSFTTAATAALTADPPAPPSEPRRKPRVRRRRQLEQHWYQCLAYPFLNWSVLLLLSAISTVWLSGVLFAIPKMSGFSVMSLEHAFPWATGAFVFVLLVAYGYATVECALTSALAGEGPAPYWPGWTVPFPLKCSVRWLVCFFAGPIVPVGLAVYFCLYGGDLTAVDWGIVAELSVVAAGYWFLAIVSANERNRLRDANPLRVAMLVQRLHYRAVVPVLVAPAVAFAHALVIFFALDSLHEHVVACWLLLTCCWGSVLFWSAFLFRLLGVWCYYTKPTEPEAFAK